MRITSEATPPPPLPERFSPELRAFVAGCLTHSVPLRPSFEDLQRHPVFASQSDSLPNIGAPAVAEWAARAKEREAEMAEYERAGSTLRLRSNSGFNQS